MSGKRVEVINQKRKTKMIRRKFKGRILKSDFQVLVKADSRIVACQLKGMMIRKESSP